MLADFESFEIQFKNCIFSIEAVTNMWINGSYRSLTYIPIRCISGGYIPYPVKKELDQALLLYETNNGYAGLSIEEFLKKFLSE